MLPVLHVTTGVSGLGGLETLMGIHRSRDEDSGADSRFLSLFDRAGPAQPDPRVRLLQFRWWWLLGRMRRRFAAEARGCPGACALYHNCWGVRLLGPGDLSRRRIGLLHNDELIFGSYLGQLEGWFDGIICMSPGILAAARSYLPDLPDERWISAALPINPTVAGTGRGREPEGVRGKPLVLGFIGRIEIDEKRIDRLEGFMAEAAEQGLDLRFELIGDGSFLPALKRRFSGDRRVVFHGRMGAADFAPRLLSWDASIFFSEGSETGPIGQLEAMAAGALPFFPKVGGSWAAGYAARLHPGCSYPPGDMAVLVRSVREIFAQPQAQIRALRAQAMALVADHTEDRYHGTVLEFVRRIDALPRISGAAGPGPVGFPATLLPLGLATRTRPQLVSGSQPKRRARFLPARAGG